MLKSIFTLYNCSIIFITGDGAITGAGTDVFVCGDPTFELISDLSLLCDGNDDCDSGLDETTSLCFGKQMLRTKRVFYTVINVSHTNRGYGIK